MKFQALLVTRGRHGKALFESEDRLTHIPIHGSDQAVDVTGAGDTVLAAYTLALASGAKPLEDRKSTRLNSSHVEISYAVFCLKKKKGEDRLARHPFHR